MKKLVMAYLLLTGSLSVPAQEIRGLYVNGFDKILGREELEDSLCDYIKECRFNQVLLYSLNDINWKAKKVKTQLRSLIGRFRNQCGVEWVGAVGENLDLFLDQVHPYNLSSSTAEEERFNIYDLEFEFWSDAAISRYYCGAYLEQAGYACTQDGAFEYVKYMINRLNALKKDLPDLLTEIYVGWLKASHAAQLSTLVDRIMPAVYLSALSDGSIDLYNPAQQKERLQNLAAGGACSVIPIFNGDRTSSDPDLYPWLIKGHSVCEPWINYLAGFTAETNPTIKKNITLLGYQWFTYQGMPPVPVLLQNPGPVEGPQNPEVQYVHQYSIPVPREADKIRWMLASVGIHTYSEANENSIEIQFREPGFDTLFIQTFACGTKSREIAFPMVIRDIGLDIRPADSKVWKEEVRTWNQPDRIVIRLDLPLPSETCLTLSDLQGRRLFSRIIPAGFFGELEIPAGEGLFLLALTCGHDRFTAKIMR